MKKLIALFLVIFTQLAFSQEGYHVKLKLENVTQKTVYLSIYGGSPSKTYTIDSASVEGKKEVEFVQKQKLIGAIYRLSFKKNDKIDNIDINLENGSNVTFSLKGNNIAAIKTTDPLNKAFVEMQTAVDRDRRKVFLEGLKKNFPKSAAAMYATLELKEFDVPTDEKELKIFRDHYWVDFDLNNKGVKILPNIYSSLYNYMKLLPINNENYKENVDLLLVNQTCKSENYLFYLKWIFMNLNYLSKYRLYDTYNYVFNAYLNDMECIKLDEKFYNKTFQDLQKMEKLPLGTVIPEVAMTDLNDQEMQISAIYPQHDYTLMVFFDPDCSHCQEKMPEIQEFFKTNQFSKDVQVLSFLNVPHDTHWKKFIADYKMENWLNVKSKNNDTKYQDELHVYGNPNYLLLNRKGEIVLKIYHEEEFKKMFK